MDGITSLVLANSIKATFAADCYASFLENPVKESYRTSFTSTVDLKESLW
jgi:hypothetical protein